MSEFRNLCFQIVNLETVINEDLVSLLKKPAYAG